MPDRVLVGSCEMPEGQTTVKVLNQGRVRALGPVDCVITINLWSAELSKLAANAFLVQRISSVDAISATSSRCLLHWQGLAHRPVLPLC